MILFGRELERKSIYDYGTKSRTLWTQMPRIIQLPCRGTSHVGAIDLFIMSWRDIHEKEGNARKDTAELAEAQDQAVSNRATAYGTLFNSRKLALTKRQGR